MSDCVANLFDVVVKSDVVVHVVKHCVVCSSVCVWCRITYLLWRHVELSVLVRSG